MPLTDEQRQALRAKAASARPQSKLPDTTREFLPDEKDLAQSGLPVNVSRETSEPIVGQPEHPAMTEETDTEQERYYSRADQEADLSLADYWDEESRRRAAIPRSVEVSDIPWNDPNTFHDDDMNADIRALTVPMSTAIVERFAIPENADEDMVYEISEMLYTYVGVVPVHLAKHTNKWLKVIGCVVQPLEGDVINERSGEVTHVKWNRPLFKLDRVDQDTGRNVVIYGGGLRGLQLARHFNEIAAHFGRPVGDWKRPRMLYIETETRGNAHVMYGFSHRACTDEEMK